MTADIATGSTRQTPPDHPVSQGVHPRIDSNGNTGYRVIGSTICEPRIVSVPRVPHCTGPGWIQAIEDYLKSRSHSNTLLLLVFDGDLSSDLKVLIEDSFELCKKQDLIRDYRLQVLHTVEQRGSMDEVSALHHLAKDVGLRRRDLFVAIGGGVLMNIVGFSAATYRRSTDWISIPLARTLWDSPAQCQLDYLDSGGQLQSGALCLRHPPTATILEVFQDVELECSLRIAQDNHRGMLNTEHHVETFDYHVMNTAGVFSTANTTLIQQYCRATPGNRRRKVLIAVDRYPSCDLAAIAAYFEYHRSEIEQFSIVPFDVDAMSKDWTSTTKILDAVLDLGMTTSDLLIAVGGGTLMDIVGFAAAIYQGGIPYLRIPTTLVGIIDAGVGVKVGVNLGPHKNLVGRYYAPIGSLNDPGSFLHTLPPEEYACGMAEALKMAIIKSSRLFELISRHRYQHRVDPEMLEIIDISIYTMLEELQPNLREHELRRIVDFGHEFGHIVEGLARYEARHGECVAVGIGLSTSLACIKGIISPEVKGQILDTLNALGLGLWIPNHDCCNPRILWTKISTDGTSHKDGKLLLVVPEAIGAAGFLNDIEDISADMVGQAVTDLRSYQACRVHESPATSLSTFIPPVTTMKRPSRRQMTRGIIGASGDLGSGLTVHFGRFRIPTVCLTRPASLQRFCERTIGMGDRPQVETGSFLHIPSLQKLIRRVDVLYCFAATVSLNCKPEDHAKVVALNGFGQAIISAQIRLLDLSETVTVVYPSTQRVHLISNNASVDEWIRHAVCAFDQEKEALMSKEDVETALVEFSASFLSIQQLPKGCNVYEVSKRLGEAFTQLLPRHVVLRISSAYGPHFRRGFICRALNPAPYGSTEVREKRDFIHVDDLNDILTDAPGSQDKLLDAASGESFDLEYAWNIIRELMEDSATISLTGSSVDQDEMSPNPLPASRLLGRDLIGMRDGLRKTVNDYLSNQRTLMPVSKFEYPQPCVTREPEVAATTINLRFKAGRLERIGQDTDTGRFFTTRINKWIDDLPRSDHLRVLEYFKAERSVSVRLRDDSSMVKLGQLTVVAGCDMIQAFFDVHTSLFPTGRGWRFNTLLEDILGRQFYHFVQLSRRGRRLLASQKDIEDEVSIAKEWRSLIRSGEKAHTLALDIGATHTRYALLGAQRLFLSRPVRTLTPKNVVDRTSPLSELQTNLGEFILRQVKAVELSHGGIAEVAISIGIVTTSAGIVHDASVFWGQQSRQYDLKGHLSRLLPGVRIIIINDVSAAAWRYHAEARFCLITVSSGLSNKVFDQRLKTLSRLDLDESAVGGEMGHVVVEPKLVSDFVAHAQHDSSLHPEAFKDSLMYRLTKGDPNNITTQSLSTCIQREDPYTVRLAAAMDVPSCQCGNLADLCSYSSGRGALQMAQSMLQSSDSPVAATDSWLQEAVDADNSLALEVLKRSTFYLAVRILQLAADLGLDKFVVVGGFAHKVGREKYLTALRDHLAQLFHPSGYFAGWVPHQVRQLVQFGVADDNDGLIGIANYARHLSSHHRAVVKSVNQSCQQMVHRATPECGAGEILLKVLYSGICTTDLQILRGQRSLEPHVLGHEGVCQVVEVGKSIHGLSPGTLVILNPNNPTDEHDKIGHNREGLYQEYLKLGKEFLDRGQIMTLARSTAIATDTLVEPLACVVAAEQRVKTHIPGQNILVVGGGMMGLLFVLLCQKLGAKRVILANRSQPKLDFAVEQKIISPENTIVLGASTSEKELHRIAEGDGIDLVFIVVSMGQGPVATERALSYVKPGGRIYLFAGFAAGATLALPPQDKAEKVVNLGSIRSTWSEEKISVNGKEIRLTGHRGCHQVDLVRASRLIDDDPLTFSKVLSHIISLDRVSDVIEDLLEGRALCGRPAKRVVVDMSAPDGTIELVGALPLRHLQEAGRRPRDQIFLGNAFREYGCDGDVSIMGWAHPPRWLDVKHFHDTLCSTSLLDAVRHIIVVGTGSWGFLADAIGALTQVNVDLSLETLQTLDPQRLTSLLAEKALSSILCIGISKSGNTTETMMLMSTLRERFEASGIKYENHFLWLSDVSGCQDGSAGEDVIRSHDDGAWKEAQILPLTFPGNSEVNALFAVPHSSPVWLIITLLTKDGLRSTHNIYNEYMLTRDSLLVGMEACAKAVATKGTGDIHILLDEDMPDHVTFLATQLIEQALGSKRGDFNPRVLVSRAPSDLHESDIDLALAPTITPTTRLLLFMDCLAHFTAILGYYLNIQFVSHPAVNRYKEVAQSLFRCPDYTPAKPVTAYSVADKIIESLQNTQRIHYVHVLLFGSSDRAQCRTVERWFASQMAAKKSNVSVAVFNGEMWNHSKYQSTSQRTDTLVVVLTEQSHGWSTIRGISTERNVRMLEAIAEATYRTLAKKALRFTLCSYNSINAAN